MEKRRRERWVTGPLGSSSWEMSAYRSAKISKDFIITGGGALQSVPADTCRVRSGFHFYIFLLGFFLACVIQIKRRARELISFSDQCESKKTTQLYLLSREVAEDKETEPNKSFSDETLFIIANLIIVILQGGFLPGSGLKSMCVKLQWP